MIRYRRSSDALSANVGDDVVALNAARGFAFSMEGVTADVWNMLDEERREEEIVTGLLGSYDVDDAQCRSETAALLAQMVDEGLIKRIEG